VRPPSRVHSGRWDELLLLWTAYQSMATCSSTDMAGNALLLWPNRLVERERMPHDLTPLYDSIADVVARLSAVGISEQEVALLRAVVLLNDATPGLLDARTVTDVRDRYYTCLYEHVVRPSSNRLSHLLLRLPTLRSIVTLHRASVGAFVPSTPTVEYLSTYLRMHGAQVCNNNGMADRQMA